MLSNTQILFLDGTFQTAPQGWTQVFILRTELKDCKGRVPVAFCLLEDKRKQSYSAALEAVCSAVPNWEPKGVITDFEQNILSAIEDLFPNSWVQGCWFHLTKCWRKYMRKINGWNNNDRLQKVVHSCYGLPHLPAGEIIHAWIDLRAEIELQYPETGDFCRYMTETWMNGLYDVELWSVHARTVSGEHRTNNVSEGSNNALRSLFGSSKPVIWTWIHKMQVHQEHSELVIAQSQVGRSNVARRKKKYVDMDNAMYTCVSNYMFVSSTDRVAYVKRMSLFTAPDKSK